MSLESRYEQLKADVEAWFQKHAFHPEVGSIAQAHLIGAKPELDAAVQKFTAPEAVEVKPLEEAVAEAVPVSPAEFSQIVSD